MKKNIFYLIFFGWVLALSRIVPHPPNFTPIIASAIVAPMLLKDRWLGIAIPIFAMFVSDLIIGFHPYQLAIYLTLISIALVAPLNKNYFKLGSIAILGSIWFFITTNFVVWLMWDYYPKSFQGLITCYTLAIPFFTNTLISTFVLSQSPLFSLILISLPLKPCISLNIIFFSDIILP